MEKLAELSHEKSFEHLKLTDCSLNFTWLYPSIEIKDIALEEKGKFRLEGAISIERRALRGAIQLGIAVNISIGCQTGKRFSAANGAVIFGRQCIYQARSIRLNKI